MVSLHYPSDRVTGFRCANTIIYIQGIPGSYEYRSLEIIFYIEDIQAPYIYIKKVSNISSWIGFLLLLLLSTGFYIIRTIMASNMRCF